MRKTIIWTVLFLLLVTFSFSQTSDQTKKQLTELFKQSLTSDSKAKGWISSEKQWVTQNCDSSYFNSDTIIFYNYSEDYYHHNKCFDQVCWSFYDKHSFRVSQYLGSKHPAPGIVGPNNFHKIKLKIIDKNLFLRTYNNGNLIDNFRVVNVTTVGNHAKLTLIRVK